MISWNAGKQVLSALALLSAFLFTNTAEANCDSTLPVTGTRDDVLIIVNDNAQGSCELARYYAERRGLGQNNIVHVLAPASYFITWDEFRVLRDQIIAAMQARIAARDPDFVPATCSDGDGPYYCQASMDQLRAATRVRYLVTTRGVPTRVRVDNSGLRFPNSPSGVDNYLRFWLVNYFNSDTAFVSLSRNRARAFGDGRGMRIVDPAVDRELIIGRIDGITLESAKAVIDRTLDAEANGLYGKVYSYTGYAPLNGSTGMRWKDYSAGQASIYQGNGDPWRYQFGIFAENEPQCSLYSDPGHYLNYGQNTAEGKAPQSCTVKLAVGVNGTNELPPARASSRMPLVDDAMLYLGYLDGQPTTGNFNEFLNWRRNATCTNTLCENLPASEQAACRAASIDVYREIDTRCVGVAEGFIGYNFQSFPVSFFHISPTGWDTGNAEGFQVGRGEVREDEGDGDNYSLWFRNTGEVASPTCFSSSAIINQEPDTPCKAVQRVQVGQIYRFATVQISDPAAPDQYRVRFRYRAQGLSRNIVLQGYLRVWEKNSSKKVTYGRVNATLSIPAGSDTGWQTAEATLTIDHTNPKHTANWDGEYQQIEFFIASNAAYSGAIGIDNVSLAKIEPAGDIPLAIKNPGFTDGHKQVATGDHAANFLSRLNGVAFWGSLSHHQSAGYSFSSHPLETTIYFMRGLPLGDAVWFAEANNSGILYGDPLYSPTAIRLASLGNEYNMVFGNADLRGNTVNGRDSTRVNTTYNIDYCTEPDFYVCDTQGLWQPTGLSGTGGTMDTALGTWQTSGLSAGMYTLRLGVSSTNGVTGRQQTFYDFSHVIVATATSDYDGDGMLDVDELAAGTNPTVTDTDGDGLSDGDEITAGTNPLSSDTDGDGATDGAEVSAGTDPLKSDTDNDGMPDGWELRYAGLNPLEDDAALDLDNDGLVNIDEFNKDTNPANPDTDRDHIQDGEEVINQTDPLSNQDRDLDGMSDDWETIRGTSPFIDDARRDADNDGVDNIIEFLRYTLPRDAASTPVINTIYVDSTNGSNDAGDGSADAPFATLARGIRSALAGDTIQLANGNYGNGNPLFLNKAVRILGNRSGVTISTGFTNISNMRWGGFENLRWSSTGYLWISNARNISFRNIEMELGDYTLLLSRNSKVLVEQALITGTGTAFNTDEPANGNNNRVGLRLNQVTLAGFQLGIDWNPNSYDLRITNSILANTVEVKDARPWQIGYSLVSENSVASAYNNLVGDARFVDAVNGDYHLLPDSPGIDTGSPYLPAGNEPGGKRRNLGYYGGTSEAAVAQDADGDGLPDGWENVVGLNPSDADDRIRDLDGDGLNNTLEYRLGTNPMLPSSRRGMVYYLLNPNQLGGSLSVMGLVDNSYIYGAGSFKQLNGYQLTDITTLDATPGARIYASQPVSLGNTADGTDLPVADWFMGYRFVIPHFRLSHKYYVYSPYGKANIKVTTDTVQHITVPRGQVVVVDAGSNNTLSGLIVSDRPLLVSHAAESNGVLMDTFAVIPPAKELVGVPSRGFVLGALEDNTTVTITDANGKMTSVLLNAGDRYTLGLDGSLSQGGGALHVVANQPVAAIQVADGDGIEATIFHDPIYFGRRYGLPVDAQYVTAVCLSASDITLYDPSGTVVSTERCIPNDAIPGSAYFGSRNNGSNIPAGYYLTGTEPFYIIYEGAASNDEKNLLGALD
ncbi:MAG TPA: TIGR03790 family protein [Gammaproteobacteria bacterium]|nr:TIGR03790 family protein [Gammaproteobacteria bacterium]